MWAVERHQNHFTGVSITHAIFRCMRPSSCHSSLAHVSNMQLETPCDWLKMVPRANFALLQNGGSCFFNLCFLSPVALQWCGWALSRYSGLSRYLFQLANLRSGHRVMKRILQQMAHRGTHSSFWQLEIELINPYQQREMCLLLLTCMYYFFSVINKSRWN